MRQMCLRGAVSVLSGLAFGCVLLGIAYAGGSSHRAVPLGSGILNGYEWRVAASRDGGRGGGQRPCLTISRADIKGNNAEHTFSGFARSCSALSSGGSPFVVSDTAGHGHREMTVFGMAVIPKVVVAYLDFGREGHMSMGLKLLNNRQQRISGVRPLRYVAFAFKGDRCLRQVKGYNADGDEIYRGSMVECPEADD